MISQPVILEQDVWEAWIEFDPYSPTLFGTLYIAGEFAVPEGSDEIEARIIETSYGRQLMLILPARRKGRCRMKEIFYSESLAEPCPYEWISIYSGHEQLARFTEIETLI